MKKNLLQPQEVFCDFSGAAVPEGQLSRSQSWIAPRRG